MHNEMRPDISQLSYLEWMDFTFRHEPAKPPWYTQSPYAPFIGDHSTILQYFSQLLSEPGTAVARYSRGELIQGLHFVTDYSGYVRLLADASVEDWVRRDCIESMATLFRDLFAHDPLEGRCFMWFENVTTGGNYQGASVRKDPVTSEALLTTLPKILSLENEECQRGALHGCNHLALVHPRRIADIVDTYLASNPSLSEALRGYALGCRDGAMP